MYEGTLSADGATPWLIVNQDGWVHVKCVNDFGGGTIHMQDEINATAWATLDGTDTAITKTNDFDEVLYFGKGDRIRFNLTGSTTPVIYWKMTGPIQTDY